MAPASAPPAPARAAHLGPHRRRPAILDAALDTFSERGYDGSSMAEIARRAGVSKPVVYACFSSKQDLFRSLLDREESRVLTEIAAALPARAGAEPERVLREGLAAFLASVAASPAAYRVALLGEGAAPGPIAARVRRGRDAQIDGVARLVEGWLRDHRVREPAEAARLAAYMLVGAAEAGARALLTEPGRFEPATMAAAMAALLVRGQQGLRSAEDCSEAPDG
jgi:AcrR family transcriptional regulator